MAHILRSTSPLGTLLLLTLTALAGCSASADGPPNASNSTGGGDAGVETPKPGADGGQTTAACNTLVEGGGSREALRIADSTKLLGSARWADGSLVLVTSNDNVSDPLGGDFHVVKVAPDGTTTKLAPSVSFANGVEIASVVVAEPRADGSFDMLATAASDGSLYFVRRNPKGGLTYWQVTSGYDKPVPVAALTNGDETTIVWRDPSRLYGDSRPFTLYALDTKALLATKPTGGSLTTTASSKIAKRTLEDHTPRHTGKEVPIAFATDGGRAWIASLKAPTGASACVNGQSCDVLASVLSFANASELVSATPAPPTTTRELVSVDQAGRFYSQMWQAPPLRIAASRGEAVLAIEEEVFDAKTSTSTRDQFAQKVGAPPGAKTPLSGNAQSIAASADAQLVTTRAGTWLCNPDSSGAGAKSTCTRVDGSGSLSLAFTPTAAAGGDTGAVFAQAAPDTGSSSMIVTVQRVACAQ
jgi:hypothetical protein